MIRARMEPGLKHDVERIFHLLGLTYTEAINMFFQQVKLREGLPFEVTLPNKTTVKAIADVDKRRGLTKNKNAKEMFKKLGI